MSRCETEDLLIAQFSLVDRNYIVKNYYPELKKVIAKFIRNARATGSSSDKKVVKVHLQQALKSIQNSSFSPVKLQQKNPIHNQSSKNLNFDQKTPLEVRVSRLGQDRQEFNQTQRLYTSPTKGQTPKMNSSPSKKSFNQDKWMLPQKHQRDHVDWLYKTRGTGRSKSKSPSRAESPTKYTPKRKEKIKIITPLDNYVINIDGDNLVTNNWDQSTISKGQTPEPAKQNQHGKKPSFSHAEYLRLIQSCDQQEVLNLANKFFNIVSGDKQTVDQNELKEFYISLANEGVSYEEIERHAKRSIHEMTPQGQNKIEQTDMVNFYLKRIHKIQMRSLFDIQNIKQLLQSQIPEEIEKICLNLFDHIALELKDLTEFRQFIISKLQDEDGDVKYVDEFIGHLKADSTVSEFTQIFQSRLQQIIKAQVLEQEQKEKAQAQIQLAKQETEILLAKVEQEFIEAAQIERQVTKKQQDEVIIQQEESKSEQITTQCSQEVEDLNNDSQASQAELQRKKKNKKKRK